MNVSLCLVLLMVVGGAAVSFASDTPQCPAAIDVRQQAREVPAGWLEYQPDSKHPLMSVEFSEGDPSKKVTLLPVEERGNVAIWNFPPSADGYWISCSYNNTSIVISRKLRSGTTWCQVEYDRDFAIPLPKKVSCTVEVGEGSRSRQPETAVGLTR